MAGNVTSTHGGKISGAIALTFETEVSLVPNDAVMVSGNYAVAKCDGSKPCVGFVDVGNVRHVGGVYPSPDVPGTVTVEAFGVAVRPIVAGGSITAGAKVGIGSDSKLHAAGGSVSTIGTALIGGSADDTIDVLIGCV